MAFHPLRTFQKHQKKFMASMVFIAMVTFIFSFGYGDAFQNIARWFGGEGRYPRVATLYGKAIDGRELQQVQKQRLLANQYIVGAVQLGMANVEKKVQTALVNWELSPKREVEQVLHERQQRTLIDQNPQFAKFFGGATTPEEKLAQIRRGLMSLNFLRAEFARQQKAAEAQLVSNLMGALELESQLRQRSNEPFYFGGSTSTESTLDFMIWRHQADQLGIRLTEQDVKVLTDRESLGQIDRDQSAELVKMVVGRQGSAADLLAALNDEFRVRMAQSALMGYDPGSYAQMPTPITPDEFWDFYREYRTEVSAAVVPIPVSEFVAQVKETPSETQLQELFEKHKDREYSPDSLTPGFKQPRRVGIEWVSGRADTPHYRKAAEMAAAALQLTNPGWFQAVLLNEYETSLKFSNPLPPWTEPSFLLSFYGDQKKPELAASAFGLILGAANCRSSPLPVVVARQGASILRTDKEKVAAAQQEIKRRAPVFATMAAVGLGRSPLQFLATWEHARQQSQYLPVDAVRGELVRKVQEKLAHELLVNSLNALKKELDSRKSRPEEARKYLAEAIKKYDLQHGVSEKPRDRFDIAEDSGLTPLKDSYMKNQQPPDVRARGFFQLFFDQARVYDAERWPRDLETSFGEFRWPSSEEPFLYWKTTDKAAYVPKFAEVKGQVEAAWKFEQARALAKKEADELAEKARANPKGAVAVLTQGSPHSGTMFTLDSVARLRPKLMSRIGQNRVYEPYTVPDDKIEYPRSDLVDRLLTLKEPKQAIVLEDRPEAHYYVAAEVEGTYRVPTIEQFYNIYRNAPATSIMSDPLFSMLERQRQAWYRQVCLEQLRTEAKLNIVQDSRRKTAEETPYED
jgi:hypothetical protein